MKFLLMPELIEKRQMSKRRSGKLAQSSSHSTLRLAASIELSLSNAYVASACKAPSEVQIADKVAVALGSVRGDFPLQAKRRASQMT